MGTSVELTAPINGKMELFRLFLNPQSHEHKEMAQMIALITGCNIPSFMFTSTMNDVNHLAANSRKVNNLLISSRTFKSAHFTKGLRARDPADFLARRLKISAAGHIVPITFRDNKGDMSAPDLQT